MASISLKNIYKIYPGDVTAVNDFNLEITDKEFIILVGPSGCGKSTTLRMIAGLEEISEGELYIGDTLVNDVEPKNRNIAMVFQSYALFPHMTVYQNIAFGLKLRKSSKDEIDQKVKEAAKILDIEHLLKRKPKTLSGGQRQRVALGRAMVRNPAVFLLDEPLSNLDAKLRSSMRTELITLHERLGTTFIYVTHDQVEAMTMGDRIVVMHEGFIQQVDTPKNLYNKPKNLFVAGFIGTPPMNFFDGIVQRTGNQYSIRIDDSDLSLPSDRFPADKISFYEGKTVVVGVRPEDLYPDNSIHTDYAAADALDATVDLAEKMGSETYVYAKRGETNIIVKVPPHTKAEAGDTLRIKMDCNRIHLFDKETQYVI